MPQLLPWLVILALLALKPNRGWSSWRIWLPLACLAAACHYLKLASQGAPNQLFQETLGMLLEVPLALAFGLAALWLLAPFLGRTHRLGTFLGSLAVLLGFIVFSFAARAGWCLAAEPIVSILDPRHCAATAHAGVAALPFVVPLVLPAPGLVAALVLCGVACRRRHSPFRLGAWLFLSLLAVWVAVSGLVYGVWRIAAPGSMEYAAFLAIGLLLVAVTFATLLPFLILSAVSPLFHERLKVLLHVGPDAPPAAGAAASLSPVAQCNGIPG